MVRQREVQGEALIWLGTSALVASRSEPGLWHVVVDGRCDCKGFQYHGDCRHLRCVRSFLMWDAESPVARLYEDVRTLTAPAA